jgi:magnesium transporter
MTTLRLPVPSARLLRFLRRQTETLEFFLPNHDASFLCEGSTVRKYRCAAQDQLAPLQASMLSFRSLAPARSPRAARIKQSSSPNLAVRCQRASSGRKPAPCKPAWREWLGGFRTPRLGRPLEPDDLPDVDREGGGSNSMFNNHRQLSKKAASEPRLRCTEVDENGNVILVDSEFKKSELIARVFTKSVQLPLANIPVNTA